MDCYGNWWCALGIITCLGVVLLFGDKQADLRQLLSDNSGAVRLVILKMTLDDLGKSANMTKNVLAVRGRFWYLATFLCGELAVCKTLRERTFTK